MIINSLVIYSGCRSLRIQTTYRSNCTYMELSLTLYSRVLQDLFIIKKFDLIYYRTLETAVKKFLIFF